MPAAPALSCMILYKNERVHLERLLPKVIAAFDEVVLVTNREASTDGSDEVVAAHGLVPQRMDWREDFAEARQFGLDRCRGDFTMWMDCDDDLVTSRGDWHAAQRDAKAFLQSATQTHFMHRIYEGHGPGYWIRENWFRRGAGVRVKYPTHELYVCPGEVGVFPDGIIDRANAPLRPDYPLKQWRYFDMLTRYLRDVDPNDSRCKFYVAREFRGPAVAQVALYLDFWRTAIVDERRCFYDESHSALALFNLRAHLPPGQLLEITDQLLLRHGFEFLSHVLHAMARCELTPAREHADRFYLVLRERERYAATRTPGTGGWYYDRALNWCGYQLYKESVRTADREMAERSIELLTEANRPDCHRDVAHLVGNNLKISQNWLSGFPR